MTHVNQRNSQSPNVHQDARPASRNRALSSSVLIFVHGHRDASPAPRCIDVSSSLAHSRCSRCSLRAPCVLPCARHAPRAPLGHSATRPHDAQAHARARTRSPCTGMARLRRHVRGDAAREARMTRRPAPVVRRAGRRAGRHVFAVGVRHLPRDVHRETPLRRARSRGGAPVARRGAAVSRARRPRWQVSSTGAPERSREKLRDEPRLPSRTLAWERRTPPRFPVLDSPPLFEAHHAVHYTARPKRRALHHACTRVARYHQATPE